MVCCDVEYAQTLFHKAFSKHYSQKSYFGSQTRLCNGNFVKTGIKDACKHHNIENQSENGTE